MGILVLVLLIPWLEGPTCSGRPAAWPLRLDAPWSLFYALLVIAGVTNYLPTRYGPAARAWRRRLRCSSTWAWRGATGRGTPRAWSGRPFPGAGRGGLGRSR